VRKGAVVIVAALALAAFAVGCGGSSEATTVPLSKAQFIKRADAICWRARQRFNALYQPFVKKYGLPEGKRRSLAEYAEAVKTALAPSVEWEVKEIRALGAPRGESRTVDAILAAVESGLEAVERHPGVQADPEKQFAESHKLARAYGLTICGQ
jgi:hypothetical protein